MKWSKEQVRGRNTELQENCCKKIAIGKAVDEVKNGLGRTANGRNNRQMEKQRKENKKVFF